MTQTKPAHARVLAALAAAAFCALGLAVARRRASDDDDDDDDDTSPEATPRSKAERHMQAWDKLNQSGDEQLVLPPFEGTPTAAHALACAAVEERLACHGARAGSRDWRGKTSAYAHGQASHPHAAVKREVNAALAAAVREAFGAELDERLRRSPSEVRHS